jgi:DNA polymerase-3 subunit delta'
MLERIAGNAALKQNLAAALAAQRLAQSVLLVGEAGCGAGFCARCLAADYLYPAGGPHAEAVLAGRDTECVTVRGEGKSGQIPIQRIREAREEMRKSALSDAAGRVLFLYNAQDLNVNSANALLKILEEPPEGALFLLTASSAATILPTIRSRCDLYTVAPVPAVECAAVLRKNRPELAQDAAEELAFLYEGHIGTCLEALQEESVRAALQNAKQVCAMAQRQDVYRTLVLLAPLEKDRDGIFRLLRQILYVASAALRRPGFAGLDSARAAQLIRQADAARGRLMGNGNARLALTSFGTGACAPVAG